MQKKLSEYWPLVWETLEALTAHYGPAIDHAAEQLGIPYGQWYGWLMAAKIFEPDPVSAARLRCACRVHKSGPPGGAVGAGRTAWDCWRRPDKASIT